MNPTPKNRTLIQLDTRRGQCKSKQGTRGLTQKDFTEGSTTDLSAELVLAAADDSFHLLQLEANLDFAYRKGREGRGERERER